jgi:hypothetical protein
MEQRAAGDFELPVTALWDGTIAKEVNWDFQQLPAMYVVREYSGFTDGGLVKASTHGVLVSKVVGTNGTKVSASNRPTFLKLAQTFQSGSASATIHSEASKFIKFPEISPDWFTAFPCAHCPDPFQFMGKVLGNGSLWAITVTGMDPIQDPAPGLAGLFDQFASGQLTFVPSAETPSLLASKTAQGEALLDAVAFNSVTPHVETAIVRSSSDAMPTLSARPPCLPGQCSPTLKGNEGIVLSGSLRTLLVIGGTSDGTENGTPSSSSWLLDVDANEWAEVPMPAGDLPGHVRAATYRAHDLEAYIVDRKAGALRLLRYLPRGNLETLATLDKAWDLPRMYLAVGELGDVVLAASRLPTGNEDHVLICHRPPGNSSKKKSLSVDPADVAGHLGHGDSLGPCAGSVGDDPGPKSAVMARFQVTGAGTVVWMGAKHLVTPLLGRPLVTSDTVLVPVPRNKLSRLRHIPFEELVLDPNQPGGGNGNQDENGKDKKKDK